MPELGDEQEAEGVIHTYNLLGLCIQPSPVDVQKHRHENVEDSAAVFSIRPLLGALVFDNADSDARDHCANERTFLSYLRLSLYMSVVSVAILLSFHLKKQPSSMELGMAKPLGIIFWCLGVICLGVGLGNYINTVNKYSWKVAIVQTGWKTQSILTVVACSIFGVCLLFLITNPTES